MTLRLLVPSSDKLFSVVSKWIYGCSFTAKRLCPSYDTMEKEAKL